MIKEFLSFETDRLKLKLVTEDDAGLILDLFNTPKWIEFIGDRKVNSIDDAINYIQTKMMPQYDKLGFGNYAVIRKKDNAKIGTCGLYDREGLNGVDIGFAFLPEYEGRGFAYEASFCIKEAAFNIFHLDQLCAITTQNNFSSQKLLVKLGLQFKKMITLKEDAEELMYYELIKGSRI